MRGPGAATMNQQLEDLRERLQGLNNDAHDIRSKAEAEKRDLSVEEANKLDGLLEGFERTKADIDRLEKLGEHTAILHGGTGRKTAPDDVRDPHAPNNDTDDTDRRTQLSQGNGNGINRRRPDVNVPADYRGVETKTGGFRSLGEFALAVRHASHQGGFKDPRLERLAPTSVANEGVGAEGGYAVPSDYRTAIMEKIMGEASLLPRTDIIRTSGNVLTIPRDNGTPWGTTGIQAYWGGEGGLKTQSRPAFDTMSLRLNKVYALVPVSDELAEDAPALDSYIRRKAPEAIDFKINLAIIQGTGSNQPLGVLNSPALITITKEATQVADTIVANNIIKMWSRLWSGSRATAIWSVNQDIETQLYTLALPGKDNTGASAAGWGSHVFMPAGGLSGSPYSTLFGRPIIPTQACETLGDKGDIVLWDPMMYLSAVKSGTNPKVDVSMHLWFDYDVSAYRFVLRMTGQPWWDAAVSPRDGSSTLSPYVALEDRT